MYKEVVAPAWPSVPEILERRVRRLDGTPLRDLSSAAVDVLTRWALDAARGDADARDALVRSAYPEVWQLCAAFVGRQSADDLAQESFIRAVRGLPRFRGDATARTWLLAIARCACTDELRARGRRRRRDLSRSALGLDRELVSPDASHASTVADLVARVEPERRVAFVLTQGLGLSYGEAAAVCECPVGTIRSRVARARADLIALIMDSDRDLEPTKIQPRAPA